MLWILELFLHQLPKKAVHLSPEKHLFPEKNFAHLQLVLRGFPGSPDGKNLPAVQETQVQSLGQKDPLEKEMETHSSIPACRIPWTEEPGELQSMGSQRVRHD